ncbi:PhoH family protein, partial [Paraburkholderia dipogonis]
MPLPTPPSKLGNLLPPDEYKAKAASPARSAAKKQAVVGESAESADYGRANVATPMAHAANAATTLRPVPASSATAVASASAEQAAPARGRKTKQTAALLQPVPASRPQAEHAAQPVVARAPRARSRRSR